MSAETVRRWELRRLYDRRDLAEARRDLAAWLAKWPGKYPKLTGWVEGTSTRR
jgi:transposase-like protein